MRTPSTQSHLYGWHHRAVVGLNPDKHDGIPECGWYKLRMTSGGPFVPARIYCDQEIDADGQLEADEVIRAVVAGQPSDPVAIWTYVQPITEAAFYRLQDMAASVPAMAATMVKIDLTSEAIKP